MTLLLSRLQHLARFWIDKMNPPASDTRDGLISRAVDYLIRNVALNFLARRWAAVDERNHLPNVPRRNGNQYGGQDDQYCRLQPKVLSKMFVEDVHVHPFHALGDV